MKLKLFIFSLLLTFFILKSECLNAQANYEYRFLRKFNSLSFSGKVNAFDTLASEKKLRCYPLVKDELDKIKQKALADKQTQILDKFQLIDAELFYLNKNFSKAIPTYLDFLIKGKIKNANDSIKILYQLKNAYMYLGSLNKAIEIHKKMVDLKNNQSNVIISNWMMQPGLSVLYSEMKLYKECLSEQLLEFDDIKNDYPSLIHYYNNRGLFWNRAGNQDSAIECYNQAKKYVALKNKNKTYTDDDKFTLGLIEGNIGQSYIKLNQYAKAIPLLKNDIICSKKVSNFHNAAISLLELSVCYTELKKFNEAKMYLDESSALMRTIEDTKTQLNIIKQYAEYYNKIGQHKISFDYLKKYNHINDSIEESKNLKELIAFQVNSQLAEKEELIKLNEKRINERNIDLERQKLIRNFLLFVGFMLVLLLVVSNIQLKKLNKKSQLLELKNKQIETRNDIIFKSLSEKDLLIKEVHHRVKNNLQIISSLLKLQSSKSNNQEVIASLSEAQDRINSMALLHQLLYRNNQMTNIKFNDYLMDLTDQIKQSFSSDKNLINIIHDQIIELELDLDTAIPLGLIANEIMSNAYKHAFVNNSGTITVGLSKVVKNRYCLKISDDGVGLEDNFEIDKIKSLGLDIVLILSEQINAELKIYNNDGTNFEIHFSTS